jgi:hypothetical protein
MSLPATPPPRVSPQCYNILFWAKTETKVTRLVFLGCSRKLSSPLKHHNIWSLLKFQVLNGMYYKKPQTLQPNDRKYATKNKLLLRKYRTHFF